MYANFDPILGYPMHYQHYRWFILLVVFHTQWFLQPGTDPTSAYQNQTASLLISNKNGWLLKADGITLKQLLDNIHDRFGITVSGLEKREAESINVQIRGKTMEAVIEGFLRHLGEDNYAFEYAEGRITHLSIFPAADTRAVESGRSVAMSEGSEDEPVRTVEIIEVVDGSQAQAVGLQKGDLIVEYDGVKINQPSRLVTETKKRSTDDLVEITVWREGIPMRLFINGGQIGIRIRLKSVPKDLMPRW